MQTADGAPLLHYSRLRAMKTVYFLHRSKMADGWLKVLSCTLLGSSLLAQAVPPPPPLRLRLGIASMLGKFGLNSSLFVGGVCEQPVCTYFSL